MIFLKRNISVLLLAGVTCMPLFYSAYYYIAKMYVEQSMEEAMEDEQLQELTLLTKEIIWLKKDKEILVGNDMFDIKSLKKKGAYTIVKGLYDYKEKELKKQLLASTSRERNDSKEHHFFKIIFSCLYPSCYNSFTNLEYFPNKYQYAVYINIMPKDNFALIPSPPPKGFLRN